MLPSSAILGNCCFSPFSSIEYIFEWEIAELDCFWHRTENCVKKNSEENTGPKLKKAVNIS